jgi:hypothetical protein
MATSTYMTFLMHKNKNSTGDTWEKLIDITEFPDLGTDPEMLETTTLSDRMQTFIMGIQGNEAMTFNTNYDKTGFTALKALRNKVEQYGVWFGGTEEEDGTVTPTGTEGKFNFSGQLNVRVTGGGVNEVRGMAITIAPTGVIVEE